MFESYKRKDFYKRLFGLLAFSPITALLAYKLYTNIIDNYFFKVLEEMEYYITPQVYRFDAP